MDLPPPPPEQRSLRPHKQLVTAWLLLLLDGNATYGYELQRALERHRVAIDSSAVYRTLRRLERNAWVESRWMPARAGPPRRLYRLTAQGRRMLAETAGLIAATRDVHDVFLQAYTRRPRPAESREDGEDGEEGEEGEAGPAAGS